ncbi:MAG TPA: hypothetical protein PLZ51_15890, partial [Aggregatilineales bacterium]|nr:hypothetical protein [Aggregatilineales bacterium]
GTVELTLFSTDTTECIVSPTPFTLTDMTPQLITITAQDDGLADGTQPCGVSILRTGGTATEYVVVANPSDVNTTVNDNDTAGDTVNTSGITAISEPNTTTSFTIQLNTMPSGTVDFA